MQYKQVCILHIYIALKVHLNVFSPMATADDGNSKATTTATKLLNGYWMCFLSYVIVILFKYHSNISYIHTAEVVYSINTLCQIMYGM